MSCQWLSVTSRPMPCAWAYGDVSFTFSLPKPSFTIIVLSKLNDRYFKAVSGRTTWTFDFVLFKKGDADPIASSSHSIFWTRSVNLEVELEAGDYVVHVRLDCSPDGPQDERKLARVLMARAKSQSMASNFNANTNAIHIPTPLRTLGGRDLLELEQQARDAAEALRLKQEMKEAVTTTPSEANRDQDTAALTAEVEDKEAMANADIHVGKSDQSPVSNRASSAINDNGEEEDDDDYEDAKDQNDKEDTDNVGTATPTLAPYESDSDDCLFLGLRVYTSKDVPILVCGQLRHEMTCEDKERTREM